MFFERHQGGDRALLVHPYYSGKPTHDYRDEFELLATSAGAETVCLMQVSIRQTPTPRFFVGSGKVEELAALVQEHDVKLALFNTDLTPTQERNLEQALQCRVVDRTGLILDIFAQRAQTFEGKLQVELAQLHHISTRLIRGWSHLERQKGGIGLRGPGETQLETDRRLIRHRIRHLQQRLEKVRGQRSQNRKARKKAELPQLSLVGYTNAGKSSLFNRITEANIYAADQLFATLDPTIKRLHLDGVGPAILSDTVGFIRDLPHKLVESFRATLEALGDADLLLHVVDCSHSERDNQMIQVQGVLKEVNAHQLPCLEVFNKIDQVEAFTPRIDRNAEGQAIRVWLSAKTGAGLDLLYTAISEYLADKMTQYALVLNAQQSKLRSVIYETGTIEHEHYDDEGYCHLHIYMARKKLFKILKQENITLDQIAAR